MAKEGKKKDLVRLLTGSDREKNCTGGDRKKTILGKEKRVI